MDSAGIEEANREVTAVIASTGSKRKQYLKLTDEHRATIGRYASEHGTASADSLKESTIRMGVQLS